MLDKEFIKRKLYLNQQELERLRAFEDLTIDEIAKDPVKHAACERFLERLIGRAIDINQHLISEKGDVTLTVLKYRDTFLRLADIGVYPNEFAKRIAPSAGLRNALVHEYNNIDQEVLHKSIGEAIREFNDYGRYILEYMEREKNGFGATGVVVAVFVFFALLVGGYWGFQEACTPPYGEPGLIAPGECKTYFSIFFEKIFKPVPRNKPESGRDEKPINVDTSTWKMYRNEQYGYEVKYPPDSHLTETGSQLEGIKTGGLIIDLPFVQGTTLSKKYFNLGIRKMAELARAEECFAIATPIEGKIETVRIGDVEFKKLLRTGSGYEESGGNTYETISYAAVDKNRCFEFNLTLRSANVGVFFSSPPPPFDKEKETAILNQILSTFKFAR